MNSPAPRASTQLPHTSISLDPTVIGKMDRALAVRAAETKAEKEVRSAGWGVGVRTGVPPPHVRTRATRTRALVLGGLWPMGAHGDIFFFGGGGRATAPTHACVLLSTAFPGVRPSLHPSQAAAAERAKGKKVRRKSRGRSKPTGIEGQKQVNHNKKVRALRAAAADTAAPRGGAGTGAGADDGGGSGLPRALSRFAAAM